MKIVELKKMKSYLVKRVSRSFKDHIPNEEIVFIFKANRAADFLVVLDICRWKVFGKERVMEEVSLTSELFGKHILRKDWFYHFLKFGYNNLLIRLVSEIWLLAIWKFKIQ